MNGVAYVYTKALIYSLQNVFEMSLYSLVALIEEQKPVCKTDCSSTRDLVLDFHSI